MEAGRANDVLLHFVCFVGEQLGDVHKTIVSELKLLKDNNPHPSPILQTVFLLKSSWKLRNLLLLLAVISVFGHVAALGEKMPFLQGWGAYWACSRWAFSMCEANFQTLIACPAPHGKAGELGNHQEPLRKNCRLLDWLQRALPNWKWTHCWLLKKQTCCWAEADNVKQAPPEGVFATWSHAGAVKGLGKKCFQASWGCQQVLLLSTERPLGLVGHSIQLLEGCHEKKELVPWVAEVRNF